MTRDSSRTPGRRPPSAASAAGRHRSDRGAPSTPTLRRSARACRMPSMPRNGDRPWKATSSQRLAIGRLPTSKHPRSWICSHYSGSRRAKLHGGCSSAWRQCQDGLGTRSCRARDFDPVSRWRGERCRASIDDVEQSTLKVIDSHPSRTSKKPAKRCYRCWVCHCGDW
jgi:hypothetical protein